jgi:hypothetical protein
VREEGGVAMAGERDCVLEDCLWARGMVSGGQKRRKGGKGRTYDVGVIEEPLLHYLRCAELVPADEEVYVSHISLDLPPQVH